MCGGYWYGYTTAFQMLSYFDFFVIYVTVLCQIQTVISCEMAQTL